MGTTAQRTWGYDVKRSERFIVRTIAACLSIIIGAVIALVRLALGHEVYTCLTVAILAAWCLLPSAGARDSLGDALREDARERGES